MARLKSLIRLSLALVGISVAGLFSVSAQAYEFVPTSLEFSAWPPHCQARYVTTDIGRQQSWSASFPQSIIDQQIGSIGFETFEKLHHYCAGLTWLDRARIERDARTKAFNLRTARAEVLFTYHGMNKKHPIGTLVMIALAKVCEASGDRECAETTLQQAIDLHPSSPAAYSALAVLYRDRKQLDQAEQVLIQGDEATEGKSAELNYILGLLLVDKKDYDNAVERAKKAYELGYPLPGLKNKLARLDKWPQEP